MVNALYVVIYDTEKEPGGRSSGEVTEEYYGYFTSPEEAHSMFQSFRGNDHLIHNARLCLQVELIEDLPNG